MSLLFRRRQARGGHGPRPWWLAALVALMLASPALAQRPRPPERQDRDRGHRILAQLYEDLQKSYYDSTFHGLDLAALKQQTDSAIDAAPSVTLIFADIWSFLNRLGDSHTSFWPPAHVANVEYGWRMSVIGDSEYITAVKPGSDAEKKGLEAGDRVIQLDGFHPSRANNWVIQVLYHTLSPRPGVVMVRERPTGLIDTLAVMASITTGQYVRDLDNPDEYLREEEAWEKEMRSLRSRYVQFGDSVLVWKLPEFVYGDEQTIDQMIDLANKHWALVLDLRDNPGGAVRTLEYLIGRFYDHADTIAFARSRGKVDTLFSTKAEHPYLGKLIVLVNSGSASAAEITSYALQSTGRAFIVGDRSMGAVQVSRSFGHTVGSMERFAQYGANIAIQELVMHDGTRLENRGVQPDYVVVPSGADLALHRDPQMAKALELAGVHRTPEEAGQLFLTDWDRQRMKGKN